MRWFLLIAITVSLVGVLLMPTQVQAQPTKCPETALSDPSLLDDPLPRTNWTSTWEFSRGAGVTVAVIDTGVAPHPRLREVIDGGDLVDGSGAFHDCDAHGTFVAGIVAAEPGHDSVYGVAPGSSILSIRQTAGEVGNLSTLATAIRSAVEAGARVINISTVSCSPPATQPAGSDEVEAAVADAESAGAVVVSAAGNISEECPEGYVSWPAVLPDVLAVTAVQHTEGPNFTDTSAETWALTGSWVDVAAHGGPVVGLDPRSDMIVDSVHRGSTPAPVVGTSFAAPVVAGTAALLLSQDPGLSPMEVRQTIIDTASPVPGAAGVGVGVVDPVAALTWPRTLSLNGGDVVPVAAPSEPSPADQAPARRLFIVAVSSAATAILIAAVALIATSSRRT